MPTQDHRWNLNVHYHHRVLDAVSPRASTALDVGSGDGLLAFDLADRGLEVTAIDSDPLSVRRAESDPRNKSRVEFIVGDVFTHPFELASFDVVSSIAMLHHVDAVKGIRRMRELVRPGGVIAIISFATPSTRADLARRIGGVIYRRSMELRGRDWEHQAPTCWPPPRSSAEMREVVDQELPGAEFRPLLSDRYVVTWTAC
jgi:2-polyprenyl-3-methyl-5-hydroxy-6-metoxy-1,4-benzoquinol methylase